MKQFDRIPAAFRLHRHTVPGEKNEGIELLFVELSDATDKDEAVLFQMLSSDEQERAAGMADRRRREFIVLRAVLRTFLADRFECEPAQVPLWIDPQGKPHVGSPEKPGRPELSIAHTDTMGILAFSPHTPIGVDVERLNRQARSDWQAVARRVFSADDLVAITNVSSEKRPEAFIRLWVRREAAVKATGVGMASAFKRFDVQDIEHPLAVPAHHKAEPTLVQITDVRLLPEFAIALAVAES